MSLRLRREPPMGPGGVSGVAGEGDPGREAQPAGADYARRSPTPGFRERRLLARELIWIKDHGPPTV